MKLTKDVEVSTSLAQVFALFKSVLSCWFSGLFEGLPADSLDVKLSERSLRMILFGSRALVPAGV